MSIEKESEKHLPETERRGIYDVPPLVDWDDEEENYEDRSDLFVATVFLCISIILAVIIVSLL